MATTAMYRKLCMKSTHSPATMMLLISYFTVNWKEDSVEMRALKKCLLPVAAKWEELARHLKVEGVAAIKVDCNYNSTSDKALFEVVEKWFSRTTRSKRTWKTLCCSP